MINSNHSKTQWFQNLPLRRVLVLGLVCPIIIMVGGVKYLDWQHEEQVLTDLVFQIQQRVGDRIQKRLEHYTTAPPLATSVLAQALNRGDLTLNDLTEWKQYLLDQGEIFNSVLYLYIGNTNGDYIELSQSPNTEDKVTIRNGKQPNISEIFNADNLTTPIRTEESEDYDPRIRPWYETARQGKAQWTDVYEFVIPEKILGGSFVRPYYDQDGKTLLGVLGADFTLTHVNHFMNGLSIGKSGEAFVINRDGRLIASSFPEAPFGPNNEPLQVVDAKSLLIQSTGQHLLQQFGDFRRISKSQSLSFHKDGQRQLVQISPFSDEYGLDWLVVVVVPESDFTEAIREHSRLTLWLSSLFFGLTILFVIAMTHKISKAMLRLSRASQAIAQGDLQQTVPGSSIQELDTMAHAFNTMSHGLQESYAKLTDYSLSLEKNVRERTQALEQEIHDRKRADEATRQSEERYHSLFEDAPISLWEEDFSEVKLHLDTLANAEQMPDIVRALETDPDLVKHCISLVRVLDVNQAALDLFDAKQKEDLLARLENHSPEALEGFKQQLIALVQGNTPFEQELVNHTLMGRKKSILFRASIAPSHSQTWSRVLISIIDISDRKRAENAMHQRTEMVSLSSQISRALMEQDIDTAITFALRELTTFTDSDRSCIFEFHSQNEFAMTHEFCRSGVPSFIRDRQLITAKTFPWFFNKLCQYRPFQITTLEELPPEASPEKLEFKRQSIISLLNIPIVYSNKVVGFLGLDSTHTPKVWSAEEIHWLQLVGERIAISQGRYKAELALKKAKEDAEVANSTKSRFLANMSHELRSPLNAILGFAQIMSRSHTLSSEHQEDIDIISRSGEHLLTLINDVLDMSKIEAGRISLTPTTFHLGHLLDDLYKMFKLKAEDKHLKLTFERHSTLPDYIQTDQGKLRQILINIIGNAIKFTDDGSVILRAYQTSEGEQHLRSMTSINLHFEIEDTGHGVSYDELDKVFDPFIQTQVSQESHEGTGLGLPISRKFVELMGGKMMMRSQVANATAYAIGTKDIVNPEVLEATNQSGTTVSFNIYVQNATEIPSQDLSPHRQIVAIASGQPHYRILIVDDKPDNRKLLAKFLKPIGFELMEATNGQEAIDLWESWHPHLIWMDLKMPIIDGIEATQTIRKTQAPNIQSSKIIALSASSFKDDEINALNAGCDAFVRKPYREADIFDVMSQQIGVRYQYEDDIEYSSLAMKSSDTDQHLNIEAFRAIPSDLIVQLEAATLRVQWTQLLDIIEEIRPYDDALAETLADTVHNFQYQKILQSIQVAKEKS